MLWAIFVFIGLLAWAVHLWQEAKKFKTIPGELGFPIIGNLLQFTTKSWFNNHTTFQEHMKKAFTKHGDTCCFWFYNRVMVATSDPRVVEKVAYHSSVNGRPKIIISVWKYFACNVFTLDSGNEWRLRKKQLSNSLRHFDHAISVDKANRLVESFSAKSGQFDCFPDILLMTIETFLATQFGMNTDMSGKTTLVEDLHFSASQMIPTSLTNPIIGLISILVSKYLYFPKEQAAFENFVAREIFDRAKQFKTDNEEKFIPAGLSMALRNMDRETALGDIKREVVEMIGAGTHTTGTATSAALVYLATNPHVQEKAWQEQQMIFGDSERDITPDDLNRMEYLDRFFNEVMRFSSAPGAIKETTMEMNIDGMIIPANTLMYFDAYKMRFDSKYWDNPMEFEPDRFLEENFLKTPKSVCEFFGYGPRSCPGIKYARFNIMVVLSTILRNFKLTSTIKFNEIKYNKLLMSEINGKYNISLERRSHNMWTDLQV